MTEPAAKYIEAEVAVQDAYLILLRMPYGPSRARLDRVLAYLRDEIALITGSTAEEIQTEFEYLAMRGNYGVHCPYRNPGCPQCYPKPVDAAARGTAPNPSDEELSGSGVIK